MDTVPLDPTDDDALRDLLRGIRRVAMVGASPSRERASYGVGHYLAEHGIEVVPVNPVHAGETLFGTEIRPDLTAVDGAVDVVDVFRRPEQLDAHADEVLAMTPRPPTVWFQLGIRNDAVAERLRAAGIRVVQDRCLKVEHRRLVARGGDA